MIAPAKAATSAWRKFIKLMHKPWLAWLVISCIVFTGILLARRARGLVRFELRALDMLTKSQSQPDKKDDLVKLVGMTEDDLKTYGYAINDEWLLKVLLKVNAQEPCVIGLDMYRDLPEPRIRFGTPSEAADLKRYAEFGESLKAMENLFVITRNPTIEAPPAMRDTDRVTANNLFKDDADGVYRRGPLWVTLKKKTESGAEVEDLDENGEPRTMPSLSLRLAIEYLGSQDIVPEWVDVVDHGVNRRLLRLGKATFQWFPSDAGGYVGEYIHDYQYLVTFESPLNYEKRFATDLDPLGQAATDTPYDYSFREVLEGKVPPGYFKDKVVLVATVMQSIKDSNPTPIHDNLRGVHQHATMIRQIIEAAYGRRPMPRWWPEWAAVLWIAGWTLLGGSLGLVLRSPIKLVPAVILTIGLLGTIVWFAWDAKALWLLFVAPASGCLLAAALVTSFVVLLERADREGMKTILQKHVSKRVAEYILSHREHLMEGGMIPGRALNATIVFTDLAGFSTASEKLTPQQTLRWLNDYMTPMVKLVEAHDGEVNKFIGDAIMALFGAPFPSGEGEAGLAVDAAKAIRCALRMREEVPRLNARWKATAPDMPPVAMRIGIFTGPIVDGSFGDTDRAEYTVIGDAVNRANRLEASGKEIKDQLTDPEKLCTILIGPKTFTLVGDQFITAPVENLALKGITERVTVHRVLSERTKSPAT